MWWWWMGKHLGEFMGFWGCLGVDIWGGGFGGYLGEVVGGAVG